MTARSNEANRASELRVLARLNTSRPNITWHHVDDGNFSVYDIWGEADGMPFCYVEVKGRTCGIDTYPDLFIDTRKLTALQMLSLTTQSPVLLVWELTDAMLWMSASDQTMKGRHGIMDGWNGGREGTKNDRQPGMFYMTGDLKRMDQK